MADKIIEGGSSAFTAQICSFRVGFITQVNQKVIFRWGIINIHQYIPVILYVAAKEVNSIFGTNHFFGKQVLRI